MRETGASDQSNRIVKRDNLNMVSSPATWSAASVAEVAQMSQAPSSLV